MFVALVCTFFVFIYNGAVVPPVRFWYVVPVHCSQSVKLIVAVGIAGCGAILYFAYGIGGVANIAIVEFAATFCRGQGGWHIGGLEGGGREKKW